MQGLGIGLDLLVVLAAAIVGGVLARLMRLPVILGYLAGGVAVGPFGLGLVHETESITSLANIGVVLLLFAIGLEFSLKELLKLGKVSVLGGIAQIVVTSAIGYILGKGLGLDNAGAVFFGFIIALSSTMVVMKLLMDRGEIDTVHGRVLLGILLVQDLSVVPMMVVMQSISGQSGTLWVSLGIALAKAVGFIALMLALGFWAMPWFMKKVAAQRSRELFLLTVVVVCLAAAFGTYYFGLSAAFGAFAAGLLISQSGFARQAFADILPLRDTFAALFFVSLGMLANLHYVAANIGTVALVVVIIMVVKFVIGSGVARIFGYSHKTTLMVGTGLIQIGEFSFVIAYDGHRNETVALFQRSLQPDYCFGYRHDAFNAFRDELQLVSLPPFKPADLVRAMDIRRQRGGLEQRYARAGAARGNLRLRRGRRPRGRGAGKTQVPLPGYRT